VLVSDDESTCLGSNKGMARGLATTAGLAVNYPRGWEADGDQALPLGVGYSMGMGRELIAIIYRLTAYFLQHVLAITSNHGYAVCCTNI